MKENRFALYNALGKKIINYPLPIINYPLSTVNYHIDVSTLPEGIYLWEALAGGEAIRGKVVILR